MASGSGLLIGGPPRLLFRILGVAEEPPFYRDVNEILQRLAQLEHHGVPNVPPEYREYEQSRLMYQLMVRHILAFFLTQYEPFSTRTMTL